MRIRIIKSYQKFRAGDVLETDDHNGQRLIRIGVAEMSKDMTTADYRTQGAGNGRPR